MACNFHAVMRNIDPTDRLPVSCRPVRVAALLCGALALASFTALAEKADRYKELTVEADQSSSGDLLNQVLFDRQVMTPGRRRKHRLIVTRVYTEPFKNAVAIGGFDIQTSQPANSV